MSILPLNSIILTPPMGHDARDSYLDENSQQQDSTVAGKNGEVEISTAEKDKHVISGSNTTLR